MKVAEKKHFYQLHELFDQIAVEHNDLWMGWLSQKDLDLSKPLSDELKAELKKEFLEMECPDLRYLHDFKCDKCDKTHFAQLDVALIYGEYHDYQGEHADKVIRCLKNVQLGIAMQFLDNTFYHLLDVIDCGVFIKKISALNPDKPEVVFVEEKHLDELSKTTIRQEDFVPRIQKHEH